MVYIEGYPTGSRPYQDAEMSVDPKFLDPVDTIYEHIVREAVIPLWYYLPVFILFLYTILVFRRMNRWNLHTYTARVVCILNKISTYFLGHRWFYEHLDRASLTCGPSCDRYLLSITVGSTIKEYLGYCTSCNGLGHTIDQCENFKPDSYLRLFFGNCMFRDSAALQRVPTTKPPTVNSAAVLDRVANPVVYRPTDFGIINKTCVTQKGVRVRVGARWFRVVVNHCTELPHRYLFVVDQTAVHVLLNILASVGLTEIVTYCLDVDVKKLPDSIVYMHVRKQLPVLETYVYMPTLVNDMVACFASLGMCVDSQCARQMNAEVVGDAVYRTYVNKNLGTPVYGESFGIALPSEESTRDYKKLTVNVTKSKPKERVVRVRFADDVMYEPDIQIVKPSDKVIKVTSTAEPMQTCSPDQIESWNDMVIRQEAGLVGRPSAVVFDSVPHVEVPTGQPTGLVLECQTVDTNVELVHYHGDMLELTDVDAVVNPANTDLIKGGGVCGAIFRAASTRLTDACTLLAPIRVATAVITPSFGLKAKHIIHAVGPQNGDAKMLRKCYTSILDCASENNLKSVAIPCISTGIYGFDRIEACVVAVDAVKKWFSGNISGLSRVVFVTFTDIERDMYSKRVTPAGPTALDVGECGDIDDVPLPLTDFADATLNVCASCCQEPCVCGNDDCCLICGAKTYFCLCACGVCENVICTCSLSEAEDECDTVQDCTFVNSKFDVKKTYTKVRQPVVSRVGASRSGGFYIALILLCFISCTGANIVDVLDHRSNTDAQCVYYHKDYTNSYPDCPIVFDTFEDWKSKNTRGYGQYILNHTIDVLAESRCFYMRSDYKNTAAVLSAEDAGTLRTYNLVGILAEYMMLDCREFELLGLRNLKFNGRGVRIEGIVSDDYVVSIRPQCIGAYRSCRCQAKSDHVHFNPSQEFYDTQYFRDYRYGFSDTQAAMRSDHILAAHLYIDSDTGVQSLYEPKLSCRTSCVNRLGLRVECGCRDLRCIKLQDAFCELDKGYQIFNYTIPYTVSMRSVFRTFDRMLLEPFTTYLGLLARGDVAIDGTVIRAFKNSAYTLASAVAVNYFGSHIPFVQHLAGKYINSSPNLFARLPGLVHGMLRYTPSAYRVSGLKSAPRTFEAPEPRRPYHVEVEETILDTPPVQEGCVHAFHSSGMYDAVGEKTVPERISDMWHGISLDRIANADIGISLEKQLAGAIHPVTCRVTGHENNLEALIRCLEADGRLGYAKYLVGDDSFIPIDKAPTVCPRGHTFVNQYNTHVEVFFVADQNGLDSGKRLFQEQVATSLHGTWPPDQCEARVCVGGPHVRPALEVIYAYIHETYGFVSMSKDPVDFLKHEYSKHWCLNGYDHWDFLAYTIRAHRNLQSGRLLYSPHACRCGRTKNYIGSIVRGYDEASFLQNAKLTCCNAIVPGYYNGEQYVKDWHSEFYMISGVPVPDVSAANYIADVVGDAMDDLLTKFAYILPKHDSLDDIFVNTLSGVGDRRLKQLVEKEHTNVFVFTGVTPDFSKTPFKTLIVPDILSEYGLKLYDHTDMRSLRDYESTFQYLPACSALHIFPFDTMMVWPRALDMLKLLLRDDRENIDMAACTRIILLVTAHAVFDEHQPRLYIPYITRENWARVDEDWFAAMSRVHYVVTYDPGHTVETSGVHAHTASVSASFYTRLFYGDTTQDAALRELGFASRGDISYDGQPIYIYALDAATYGLATVFFKRFSFEYVDYTPGVGPDGNVLFYRDSSCFELPTFRDHVYVWQDVVIDCESYATRYTRDIVNACYEHRFRNVTLYIPVYDAGIFGNAYDDRIREHSIKLGANGVELIASAIAYRIEDQVVNIFHAIGAVGRYAYFYVRAGRVYCNLEFDMRTNYQHVNGSVLGGDWFAAIGPDDICLCRPTGFVYIDAALLRMHRFARIGMKMILHTIIGLLMLFVVMLLLEHNRFYYICFQSIRLVSTLATVGRHMGVFLNWRYGAFAWIAGYFVGPLEFLTDLPVVAILGALFVYDTVNVINSYRRNLHFAGAYGFFCFVLSVLLVFYGFTCVFLVYGMELLFFFTLAACIYCVYREHRDLWMVDVPVEISSKAAMDMFLACSKQMRCADAKPFRDLLHTLMRNERRLIGPGAGLTPNMRLYRLMLDIYDNYYRTGAKNAGGGVYMYNPSLLYAEVGFAKFCLDNDIYNVPKCKLEGNVTSVQDTRFRTDTVIDCIVQLMYGTDDCVNGGVLNRLHGFICGGVLYIERHLFRDDYAAPDWTRLQICVPGCVGQAMEIFPDYTTARPVNTLWAINVGVPGFRGGVQRDVSKFVGDVYMYLPENGGGLSCVTGCADGSKHSINTQPGHCGLPIFTASGKLLGLHTASGTYGFRSDFFTKLYPENLLVANYYLGLDGICTLGPDYDLGSSSSRQRLASVPVYSHANFLNAVRAYEPLLDGLSVGRPISDEQFCAELGVEPIKFVDIAGGCAADVHLLKRFMSIPYGQLIEFLQRPRGDVTGQVLNFVTMLRVNLDVEFAVGTRYESIVGACRIDMESQIDVVRLFSVSMGFGVIPLFIQLLMYARAGAGYNLSGFLRYVVVPLFVNLVLNVAFATFIVIYGDVYGQDVITLEVFRILYFLAIISSLRKGWWILFVLDPILLAKYAKFGLRAVVFDFSYYGFMCTWGLVLVVYFVSYIMDRLSNWHRGCVLEGEQLVDVRRAMLQELLTYFKVLVRCPDYAIISAFAERLQSMLDSGDCSGVLIDSFMHDLFERFPRLYKLTFALTSTITPERICEILAIRADEILCTDIVVETLAFGDVLSRLVRNDMAYVLEFSVTDFMDIIKDGSYEKFLELVSEFTSYIATETDENIFHLFTTYAPLLQEFRANIKQLANVPCSRETVKGYNVAISAVDGIFGKLKVIHNRYKNELSVRQAASVKAAKKGMADEQRKLDELRVKDELNNQVTRAMYRVLVCVSFLDALKQINAENYRQFLARFQQHLPVATFQRIMGYCKDELVDVERAVQVYKQTEPKTDADAVLVCRHDDDRKFCDFCAEKHVLERYAKNLVSSDICVVHRKDCSCDACVYKLNIVNIEAEILNFISGVPAYCGEYLRCDAAHAHSYFRCYDRLSRMFSEHALYCVSCQDRFKLGKHPVCNRNGAYGDFRAHVRAVFSCAVCRGCAHCPCGTKAVSCKGVGHHYAIGTAPVDLVESTAESFTTVTFQTRYVPVWKANITGTGSTLYRDGIVVAGWGDGGIDGTIEFPNIKLDEAGKYKVCVGMNVVSKFKQFEQVVRLVRQNYEYWAQSELESENDTKEYALQAGQPEFGEYAPDMPCVDFGVVLGLEIDHEKSPDECGQVVYKISPPAVPKGILDGVRLAVLGEPVKVDISHRNKSVAKSQPRTCAQPSVEAKTDSALTHKKSVAKQFGTGFSFVPSIEPDTAVIPESRRRTARAMGSVAIMTTAVPPEAAPIELPPPDIASLEVDPSFCIMELREHFSGLVAGSNERLILESALLDLLADIKSEGKTRGSNLN